MKGMYLVLGLVLFFKMVSCSKANSSKCHYSSPPNSLFFQLKKSGGRLSDSILNNLKLSYIENGTQKIVPDLVRATGEGYNFGIMTTRQIGILSADKNIKQFFIEYPSGIQDTLYADYEKPSPRNNCLYSIKQIEYNSQVSVPDPNITQQIVYSFNKP